MYPVSDRFLKEIRSSAHTVVSHVELWRKGVMIGTVPIVDGKIEDDSQALFRRRLSLRLPPEREVLDAIPVNVPENRGLWPLGNELGVFQGLRYDDGTEEYVPLGIYRINRARLAESDGDITVEVEGWDRGRTISRNRFRQTYTVRSGQPYNDGIQGLMIDRFPRLADVEFLFPPNGFITPQLIFVTEDDPWEVCMNMAKSLGNELLFDGVGRPLMRNELNPGTTESVFDYIEGEDCTMTDLDRDLDDDLAYNVAVVTGSNTSNTVPPRGEAYDLDPNSPTYFDPAFPDESEYGAVPVFLTSEFVTTDGQARNAAGAELLRHSGIVESIKFSGVNNFAHESGDPISIKRQRIGVNSMYTLDSLTIGVGANVSMSGNTRRRRASFRS